MTETPFFSVIIPTHKRPALLRRALISIIEQSGPAAFEIIVISDVTDSGTDAVCAEMLRPQDIYVRRNGHPGPSASRNLGLSLRRGRYVLFLDDDDAWQPDLLARLYARDEVRQGEPIYFDCSVIVERRLPSGPELISEGELSYAGQLDERVYVKNQVHMSCFAFPAPLIEGLSFDPFMRAYEDWEYLLAVFDREFPRHVPILGSRVYEVRDDTTDRRGSSTGANDYNAVLDYLYVYRRHPGPTPDIKAERAKLLGVCGMQLDPQLL